MPLPSGKIGDDDRHDHHEDHNDDDDEDDEDDDDDDDDDGHDHHDDHSDKTGLSQQFYQTTSAKPPTRKPDRTKRVVGKVSGCYNGWGG